MYEAILYTTVAFILPSMLNHMVTIIRHVVIRIFQTEYFSAVKFAMCYQNKYDLSCDTKISKSLKTWTELLKYHKQSFNGYPVELQ